MYENQFLYGMIDKQRAKEKRQEEMHEAKIKYLAKSTKRLSEVSTLQRQVFDLTNRVARLERIIIDNNLNTNQSEDVEKVEVS